MARRYSEGAQSKVQKAMQERKRGKLKSGSGKKVKSKKQAIAIALSEARRAGEKVIGINILNRQCPHTGADIDPDYATIVS